MRHPKIPSLGTSVASVRLRETKEVSREPVERKATGTFYHFAATPVLKMRKRSRKQWPRLSASISLTIVREKFGSFLFPLSFLSTTLTVGKSLIIKNCNKDDRRFSDSRFMAKRVGNWLTMEFDLTCKRVLFCIRKNLFGEVFVDTLLIQKYWDIYKIRKLK